MLRREWLSSVRFTERVFFFRVSFPPFKQPFSTYVFISFGLWDPFADFDQ